MARCERGCLWRPHPRQKSFFCAYSFEDERLSSGIGKERKGRTGAKRVLASSARRVPGCKHDAAEELGVRRGLHIRMSYR